MARFLIVTVSSLLLINACSEEVPTPVPAAPAIPNVAEPAAPAKKVEVPFDRSLDTQEQTDAWIKALSELAATEKDLPADTFTPLLSLFKPPAHPADAFLAPPPEVEDKPTAPIVEIPPSAAKAEEWENDNKRVWAAREYLRLHDLVGAKRCAAALRSDFEWPSAGSLAVDLNDQKLFNEAISALVKADQISNTYDLFEEAMNGNHKEWVTSALKRHKLDPTKNQYGAEELARAGDNSYLKTYLKQSIDEKLGQVSSKNDRGDGQKTLLVHIITLVPLDRPAALQALETYIRKGGALITEIDGGGEGGNFIAPATNAEAVWKLVRGQKELRTLYAKSVEKELADLKPTNDNRISTSSFLELFASASKDWEWANVLAKFVKSPPYLREASRLVFGQKADPKAVDLTENERYVIGWLSGATPVKNSSWFDRDPEDDLNLVDILTRGRINTKDALRVWKQVGLPVDQDDSRVKPADFEATLTAIAALTYQETDSWDISLARLIRSGYKGTRGMPTDIRAVCTNQPDDNQAPCNSPYMRTAYAMLRAGRAWPPSIDLLLRATTLGSIERVRYKRLAWENDLGAMVKKPIDIAEKNQQLLKSHDPHMSFPPKLASHEEALKLLERGLTAVLREKISQSTYEKLLAWLTARGYPEPLDAEIDRCMASNANLADILRLQALRKK